jgi:hypothetical protein
MYTTTITADVEDLNDLLVLFLQFDAKEIKSDRLQNNRAYSTIPIELQQFLVLIGCAVGPV